METTKLFTQKEVNKIFSHIPNKTLRWWGMGDLYGWADQVNDGRGIHRLYEVGNLYQIGIVEELSSLNIPVEVINKIMRKNFLSGLVMYPVEPDLEKDEIGGGKQVNVADQMNKILVITKELSQLHMFHKKRRPPEYEAFLTNKAEDEIVLGPGELFLDSVKIIINLRRIKGFVDSLIRDFTGGRLDLSDIDLSDI
ncbi:MAG: hypothetical protein ACOZFS_10230 [Thermodesulfobacteriota bacterium]